MISAGSQRSETAAVQSLAAGTDMVIVWPPDLRRTHREIQAAINDNRLTRERLREAAERIIFEKIRLGLINGE
jgi:beta-N-acetylhexosaminidase